VRSPSGIVHDRIEKWFGGRNFFIFSVLILLILIPPFVEGRPAGHFIISVLLILIPIAGFVTTSGSRAKTITLVALSIIPVGGTIAAVFGWNVFAMPTTVLLFGVLYGFIAASIVQNIFNTDTINADTIYGIISVYVLFAFVWAALFQFMYDMNPEHFRITAGDGGTIDYLDFLYYSVITLTTLGYGEIIPLTSKARALAMLESIAGVLFLATVIARVVAVHTSVSTERKRKERQERQQLKATEKQKDKAEKDERKLKAEAGAERQKAEQAQQKLKTMKADDKRKDPGDEA